MQATYSASIYIAVCTKDLLGGGHSVGWKSLVTTLAIGYKTKRVEDRKIQNL